jgi:3-hydroxyisobutyrate dehydrogenase-like beta-hydroxyacid dehydrogenase
MQGDRAVRAQAKILAKDLRLAADWARASGAEASLGVEARAVFEAVLAAGLGEQDDAALFDALSAAASRAEGAAG